MERRLIKPKWSDEIIMSSIVTEVFLKSLLSPDGSQRAYAEAYWHSLPVQQRVQELRLALPSHTGHLQQLVAVLLRRDILRMNHSDDEEILNRLLHELLPFFCSSPSAAVGDCVTEIVFVLNERNESASIQAMQNILHASSTAVTTLGHPVALKLWISLAERVPRVFGQVAAAHVGEQMRAAARAGASPALVLKAVVQAAQTTKQPDVISDMATACVVPILRDTTYDESTLTLLFEQLMDAAADVPELLSPIVETVILFCCQAVGMPSTSIQLQSVQVIVTYAEHYARSQQRTTQLPSLIAAMQQELIPHMLRLLLEYPGYDEDTWMEVPFDDEGAMHDDDDDYTAQLLQDMLRLAGRPILVHTILPAVQPCIEDASLDWKALRGALVALQSAAIALPVSFAPYGSVARRWALQQCQSSHSVLQYNALILLGLLMDENVDDEHLPLFVDTLSHLLRSPVVKVSSTAACCVVSLARSENDIQPFMSTLLDALSSVPAHPVSQVRAVGAVAALAQVSQEDFIPYYAGVMPGILSLLSQPQSEEQLRTAALETATIVGQAVGQDTFQSDAVQLLQLILTQTQPPLEHLVACARIASVLEDTYTPYCAAVVPHLLQRASESTDVKLSEGTEQDLAATQENRVVVNEEDGTQSMTVALPGRGYTKVTLNTSSMQEKTLAIRAIYEHAAALGANFGPYVKVSFDTLLPLLQFRYSSELRAVSAQTLAAVFEASCAAGVDANSLEFSRGIFPVLVGSISGQIENEAPDELENLFALADSLSDILYAVYIRLEDSDVLLANFDLNQSNQLVQSCMRSLMACLRRRDEISKQMATASSEDEVEEIKKQLATEDSLLTPLVDSIGYNLKIFKQGFFPIFQKEVAPILGPYLHGGDDAQATLSAVCLFDDCVEHCGSDAAATFGPVLAQASVRGLSSSNEDLIRASIYGIIQIARYSPPSVLSAHLNAIVPRITSFASDNVKENHAAIYENAVSALASLVLFPTAPFRGSSAIKVDTAIQLFVSALPLSEDGDEAKICHAGFCDLLEDASTAKHIMDLIGADAIVEIIGNTLALVSDDQDVATDETAARFTQILVRLQKQVPNLTLHNLSEESQSAIHAAMGQYAHASFKVVTL